MWLINTVKAAAEMDENFAGGRFYCCCEIVDSDLRTNQRNHGRGAWFAS
jgi:hypothetical protein